MNLTAHPPSGKIALVILGLWVLPPMIGGLLLLLVLT